MLDLFSQRRQNIGAQVKDILTTRGPLPAYKREALDSLLREASDLEHGIHTEHEKRQGAAFRNWIRGGSAEQRALLRQVSLRDMGEAGLGTGAATGAGVFVPIDWQNACVSAMKSYSALLDECNIIETTTGRNLPVPNDFDAALEGELLGEGQQASLADISSPSQTIIRAFRFSSKIIRISTELLEDQEIDMPSYLARQMGIRLARVISQYATTGSGVNQPLGFMNSSTMVSAGVAAGAYANDGVSGGNSLGVSDLSQLLGAIDPAYRNNAKFIVNPSTLQSMTSQLDKQGRWLWPGLHDSPDGVPRLLNKEVITSPFMDTLQTNASSPQVVRKPIACADWSRFSIRKTPIALFRLVERFAEYGQVAFLAVMRGDSAFTDVGACAAFLTTQY